MRTPKAITQLRCAVLWSQVTSTLGRTPYHLHFLGSINFMEYVLISSCLLGKAVRYDGQHKLSQSPILQQWIEEGRVVSVCPEVEGGMSIPRPPAEIANGSGGAAVLIGSARVMQDNGRDATAQFINGANEALEKVRAKGIRVAVLKEGSPSCGSGYTYDGSFLGTTVQQPGVTTERLRQAGVNVFSEDQWLEAQAEINRLERTRAA